MHFESLYRPYTVLIASLSHPIPFLSHCVASIPPYTVPRPSLYLPYTVPMQSLYRPCSVPIPSLYRPYTVLYRSYTVATPFYTVPIPSYTVLIPPYTVPMAATHLRWKVLYLIFSPCMVSTTASRPGPRTFRRRCVATMGTV